MKALKINDYGSTCFDASLSAGHFSGNSNIEYAAIPDAYAEAVRATSVARKHSSNYVLLDFPEKESVRIASFIASCPQEAIKEAKAALLEYKVTEDNTGWWTDVD